MKFSKGIYYFLAKLEDSSKIHDLLLNVVYGPGVEIPLEINDIAYEVAEMVKDKSPVIAGQFEFREYRVDDLIEAGVTLAYSFDVRNLFTAMQTKVDFDRVCCNE